MSLVRSSDSGCRTLDAIDRRLGRIVGCETGDDDPLEHGVVSLDGRKDESYDLCIGGSLYFSSPALKRGYNDLDEEVTDDGVSLAGGPRYTGTGSLGSTGSGRDDCVPGATFNGTIVRIDLGM